MNIYVSACYSHDCKYHTKDGGCRKSNTYLEGNGQCAKFEKKSKKARPRPMTEKEIENLADAEAGLLGVGSVEFLERHSEIMEEIDAIKKWESGGKDAAT